MKIKKTLQKISWISLLCCSLSIIGCSSAVQKSSQVIPKDSIDYAKPEKISYRLHLKVLSAVTSPFDDIYIDTTGQMVFSTTQQMSNGELRKPKGFAYLNKPDEDTLFRFISRNSLFDIKESDVKPECPQGEVLFFNIYRTDIKKSVAFTTNTCVLISNLLIGPQRKEFPEFIGFVQRLRDRYRPELSE